MSYCINPNCPSPQNPDYLKYCQACGSSLIYDEFLYRAIQPLERQTERGNGKRRDTQLYEVTEHEGNRAILKVLTNNSSRSTALFEREIQILQQLTHLGIPKFERTFTVVTSGGTTLHCLVMEKIEGQNLEQRLEKQGSLPEAIALNWLKQLTEILYVLHRNRFLHQDIKPSNIMRKPDDQLVLVDFSNVPGIVSAGYTPPEQADGKAVPQSDFFALGRTFVHLVTGKHPIDLPKNPETRTLIWRSHAPQITQPFADLIDDLMASLPQNRPQTAQAVLSRINELLSDSAPLKGRSNKKLIGATILSAGLIGAFVYFGTRSPLTCNFIRQNYLSCGEESLFPVIPIPEKQQGIDAFKASNYQSAITWLEKARNRQMGDPETLIYLNNARLESQAEQAYTIAVVAPIKNSPNLSAEILRGIAQAQDEINHKKIHGKGLKVLIADDANDQGKANQVAKELVKRKDILGVLGHYTSEMSLSTLDIYQADNLVLISYGSTSTDLSPYGLKPGHVFFRSVPTTQVTALALTSYLAKQLPQQKVAVFYNPQSPYSRSLRDQFQLSIDSSGGKIIEEFDLCQVVFNAENNLDQAQHQGATAIALFPDGRICAASYPNVLATIRANSKRYPIMVSGWTLSRAETLESVRDYAVEKLVVAAPWHQLSSPNLDFLETAETLWGKSEVWGEGVNGATAMTYDAAKALIAALANPSQPNSRAEVRNVLAEPSFQATGATGIIRFLGGDRREPVNVLLKVVPSKNCNHYGYSFVPANHPAAKDGMLDCLPLRQPVKVDK